MKRSGKHWGLLTLGLLVGFSLTIVSCDRGGSETEMVESAPPTETTEETAEETTVASPETNPETDSEATPEETTPAEPTAPAQVQQAQPGNSGTAINPPQAATLTAQQASAQINLRSRPNADSSSKGYGLVGDSVRLLRTSEGQDGYTWYYVKFAESGAEGWVRGDFVNTSGRPTAAAVNSTPTAASVCEGVFEETVFKAYYSSNGFTRIEFRNLETNATFQGSLQRQGQDAQGNPVYVGSVTPPAGGSYEARVTDLSGGNPAGGSQVALNYADIPATGTCQ